MEAEKVGGGKRDGEGRESGRSGRRAEVFSALLKLNGDTREIHRRSLAPPICDHPFFIGLTLGVEK